MDIEQLKLVLEAVTSVGEGAQDIAIAWLVIDGLVPYCIGVLALTFGYRIAIKFFAALTFLDELKELRGKLRINCGGKLSESETADILKRLREITDRRGW